MKRRTQGASAAIVVMMLLFAPLFGLATASADKKSGSPIAELALKVKGWDCDG
jgi:hypothetical protein